MYNDIFSALKYGRSRVTNSFFPSASPLMVRREQSGRSTRGYNIRPDIISTKAGSLWIPVPVRSMPVSPWCGESGQGPRDTDRLINPPTWKGK